MNGRPKRIRQRILITGASSGLGAGMARAFAAKGRDLALCARRTDQLEELKAELLQRHPNIRVAVAELDVDDHDRVPEVFTALAAELGGLDCVIVNAGFTPILSRRWSRSRRLWRSSRSSAPDTWCSSPASWATRVSAGAEYASGPIKVTVIEPGYIESEMTARTARTMLMVDNATGVAMMVDAIERERGRAIIPGWPWVPLVAVLKALPPRFTKPFA